MYFFEILCFLLVVGFVTCEEFYFYKIECYKLSADVQMGFNFETAVEWCTNSPGCVGLRELSENSVGVLMYPLVNATRQADWSNDYILDRSNGTVLKNAPTVLASKLIFGIYFTETQTNCPYPMKEVNSRCEGTYKGGEERCKSFPDYMNRTFDPTTGKCSVVPLRELVKKWQ